jgi:hypothetical protein
MSPPGTEWDADFLRSNLPEYVVLSQFEYEDRLRISDSSARDYFDVLRVNYTETQFGEGIRIRRQIASRFTPWLPQDMSYANPVIKVYIRKKANSNG